MKTKFKLVLMSFGVTMLVTIGLAVVSLYTYHQGANLHQAKATGPAQSELDQLAVPNPATIATSTPVPVQTAPTQPEVQSPAGTARENGHSPFVDPSKVIGNMGSDNPALQRAKPAFLRVEL